MLPVACKEGIKVWSMHIAERSPARFLVLDNRGNDLIGLGEVIVHADVLEALRHTPPAIRFFFRKLVDIIADLLMGNEHQMKL